MRISQVGSLSFFLFLAGFLPAVSQDPASLASPPAATDAAPAAPLLWHDRRGVASRGVCPKDCGVLVR